MVFSEGDGIGKGERIASIFIGYLRNVCIQICQGGVGLQDTFELDLCEAALGGGIVRQSDVPVFGGSRDGKDIPS